MKRVFGRQTRRSFGAARKTCVPALATQPVPTVVIFERTKRITSWIGSPDSTWPPGEEISTVIGASDSSASAIRRVQVLRATAWLISPNTSTKRDLKASRSAITSGRSSGSGFSSLASIGSPGKVRHGTTPARRPFDSVACNFHCGARPGAPQPARAGDVVLPRVHQPARPQDAARILGALRPAAHGQLALGQRHQELLGRGREARRAAPFQAGERPPPEGGEPARSVRAAGEQPASVSQAARAHREAARAAQAQAQEVVVTFPRPCRSSPPPS